LIFVTDYEMRLSPLVAKSAAVSGAETREFQSANLKAETNATKLRPRMAENLVRGRGFGFALLWINIHADAAEE
jgi:hypothetical protein